MEPLCFWFEIQTLFFQLVQEKKRAIEQGEEDEDDEIEDPYRKAASSEFLDGEPKSSSLVASSDVVTNMDWRN